MKRGFTALLVAVALARAAFAQQAIDKSDSMQAGRLKLMEKLRTQQVFLKVEMPGTLPRLYVQPRFYTLDIDMKEKFVSVVYAYYFDGKKITDSVRIYDGRTGKEVGNFSLPGGLKMD